jgi:hypothetical protein
VKPPPANSKLTVSPPVPCPTPPPTTALKVLSSRPSTRIILTTPATASDPYIDDAPDVRTSILSTAANGIDA